MKTEKRTHDMKNMTIKKQLSLIFIIITIVPIGILGIFHSIEITDFISQTSKNQKYATQRLAESVETYVNFHVNYIESISYNLSQSQNSDREFMTMLLKGGKTKLPGFIELYVGNSEGKIIASYPCNRQNGEFLLGEDISNRDHFKEIKAAERTVVTPILLGRHSKKPLIMIAAPILYENQFQGYVLGTLDLTALTNLITDYDYGTGAYPVVEDQEQKIIYHPVQPSISKNYDVKNHKEQNHLEKRNRGDGEYYSTVYHRYEYLQFEMIPSLNWTVYVAKPASIKTESIRSALFLLGMVLFVTLLFTQYLSRLLSRRMLEPINVLLDYSAAIEEKSFSLKNFDRIQILNAAREFNLLLHRFYEMGSKVFQNREELINLNLDLERRIEERTKGLVLKNHQLELINRLNYQPLPVMEPQEFLSSTLKELSELVETPVTYAAEEEISTHAPLPIGQFSVPVSVTGKRLGYLFIGQMLDLPNQEFLQVFARSLAMVVYNDMLLAHLRNRNAILKTATENMNDGFVLVTKQAEITYANDLFAQTLELSHVQIVNKKLAAILSLIRFSEENYGEHLLSALDEQTSHVNFAINRKDGKQKHLSLTKFPVHDEEETFGFGLVLRDITKETEMDLLKNQLISFTSHEFKTPLTTLNSSIETLMRKDVEWEEAFIDEIFLGMTDDVKRLEQLTSDWLDIVKIDSNALVLIKEQTRIGSFVEGVLQGLRKPPFDQAKIIYTWTESSEQVLFFDMKRLEQVIRNIITNAIRYSRGNPTILVRIYEDDWNIFIDFQDNGIGMAAEHLLKIFDKFYHVDISRTRKTGGTGLGLAICKGILDSHGWKVNVASEINKGSTFTIVIPKVEQVNEC
ncbi:sensor histidine kinase [Neobacillus rhizosphaerae]|uniref:sensor histidine kinase n=1 Tax=Neobacillus rhizosphaerae TaxID=2880965 RepID=UPI00200F5C9C|nr:ATP-binding protein [Neobacillus rhizosphaerae]